jgi:alpha-L-arabinofuranosidase
MRGVDATSNSSRAGQQPQRRRIGWNRTATTLRNTIDYIGIHTYINNRDDNLRSSSLVVDDQHYIDVTAGLIRQAQSGQRNPRPIHRLRRVERVAPSRRRTREVYTFEDSAGDRDVLQRVLQARRCRGVNLAQMVNVIAPS